MEDVDGLLGGLLFFGAVVWAGHFWGYFCLDGGLGGELSLDCGLVVAAFFLWCGGGDV